MKNLLFKFLTAAVFAGGVSSCASGPNAQTGTVLGALGGAAAGGIIGHQSGRGLEGAAIGGGLGAVGGNVIGNAQDQRNNQNYYRSRNRGYYQEPAPQYYREERSYRQRGYGY